ncbi:unnamed protein product [Auanema sp. JU1783]|nr:unnamed protein product [Auanema sp. JU1783]
MQLQTFVLAIFVFQESVQATSYDVRQRSRYICGTEPYLFYSDIECSLHQVCVNGGMSLQVGCANDFQCQGIRFDARCINSCCCTLPRLLETTTPLRLRDNSSPSTWMPPLFISLVTTFLYLAV